MSEANLWCSVALVTISLRSSQSSVWTVVKRGFELFWDREWNAYEQSECIRRRQSDDNWSIKPVQTKALPVYAAAREPHYCLEIKRHSHSVKTYRDNLEGQNEAWETLWPFQYSMQKQTSGPGWTLMTLPINMFIALKCWRCEQYKSRYIENKNGITHQKIWNRNEYWSKQKEYLFNFITYFIPCYLSFSLPPSS